MLNNIINLTKVFFKTSFNKSSKSKNKIVRILLLVVLFAYVGSAFGFLSYEIIMGLKAINQEEAFLGLIFMAIITVTLFTTIISTVSVLYFSQDNQYILGNHYNNLCYTNLVMCDRTWGRYCSYYIHQQIL